MNPDRDKAPKPPPPNPFGVCFLVFLLLACDYGFRLYNLAVQHKQLDQAQLMQTQNVGALSQARQLEARIEALSLDLLQVAKTNDAAKKIVQEFNIQWNPGPGTPAAPQASPPAPAPQKK
ncbi:MAG TPA: hypothetical protein VMU04_11395 [Candidatus Acidoferrum sp.]|nr:hypothetical protein [Candidatus Acidoferrum sp.]